MGTFNDINNVILLEVSNQSEPDPLLKSLKFIK